MTCLDAFLSRRYNKETYNCAHFVRDVWQELTGMDLGAEFEGFLRPPKDRYTDPAIRRAFKRLNKPSSPCVVLMQRRGCVPHVGVFVRGKIIHLHEQGVEFLPVEVATRGFKKLGFYDAASHSST